MKTEDVNRLIDQRKALYCTPEVTREGTREVTREVTGEVPCKTDPRAPHGFDRNASHSADRYVCECEGWEPDVGNSAHKAEERVHKTDKSIHEPVAWVLHRELFWPSEYEVISEADDNAIPLYTAPPQKEWVGLTPQEFNEIKDNSTTIGYSILQTEAKLKEKNA